MVCEIRIWGNWIPTMRWQVNGKHVEDNRTLTHHDFSSVSSAITLVINSNIFFQSSVQVSCLTHFTLENILESNSASNIPDYNHMWVAPRLIIKKGQSLKIERFLQIQTNLNVFWLSSTTLAQWLTRSTRPQGGSRLSYIEWHTNLVECHLAPSNHSLLIQDRADENSGKGLSPSPGNSLKNHEWCDLV